LNVVQAAGRLVEGVAGLERPGGVVVDGPLVLALQDVAERRAGVTMHHLDLARLQGHFDRRGLRLLPVDLLGDVLLGEHLDALPAFAAAGAHLPTLNTTTNEGSEHGTLA
jgi:hypothetical protein